MGVASVRVVEGDGKRVSRGMYPLHLLGSTWLAFNWKAFLFFLYYRPQRSCGKVIFSQACVKNSVHKRRGVCLNACWDTHTPPWQMHTPWCLPQCMLGYTPPRRQTPLGRQPPPRTDTPSTRRSLQRTVRILLECFLVYNLFVHRNLKSSSLTRAWTAIVLEVTTS